MRRCYGVPAKRGARVIIDGCPGAITAVVAHPTWQVTYLDAAGQPAEPSS